MFRTVSNINHRNLAKIFTDTTQHKAVAEIIRNHSTNRLDVRTVALDSLQLNSSKVVLDIGCGFGFFTLALKDRLNFGSKILGIEFCENYKISYLESCKMAGIQGEFSPSDEKTIKTITTDSIDLVICSYALYFFPEIIPEISRVLKSSGIFVVITHSENHLTEAISFVNETLDVIGTQRPDSLPCQNLIANFNNKNGYRLLSKCFGQVEEIEYHNSLRFEISDFKDLEKYLRFKQPYYIPNYLDNKNKVFDKMINSLHVYLQSGNHFNITKDDTIFICKEPLSVI